MGSSAAKGIVYAINESFFVFQSLRLLILLSVISTASVSSQQHEGVYQVPNGGRDSRQVLLPPPLIPRNNPPEEAEKEGKTILPFLVLGTQQVEVFVH